MATAGVPPSIDDRSMLSYFLHRSMELIFARHTPVCTPVSGENDFQRIDCRTRWLRASKDQHQSQILLFSQPYISPHPSFLANANSRSRSLIMSSSVRLSSVCLSSVMFVHPTQEIEIFGNVSTPFGTLAIWRHPGEILWRSSEEKPSVGGVKHKRGSRI